MSWTNALLEQGPCRGLPSEPMQRTTGRSAYAAWGPSSVDVTAKPIEENAWALSDLLGRSMGRIVETNGAFTIVPEGEALTTMAGMKPGPHASLDKALAQIETHTRGVCRLVPEGSGDA